MKLHFFKSIITIEFHFLKIDHWYEASFFEGRIITMEFHFLKIDHWYGISFFENRSLV